MIVPIEIQPDEAMVLQSVWLLCTTLVTAQAASWPELDLFFLPRLDTASRVIACNR